MIEPERVGMIIDRIEDLQGAATKLAEVLARSDFDRWQVRRLGLEPDLVESLWAQLGQDTVAIERTCAIGLAWALGRRTTQRADGWAPVASLPSGDPLPRGLRRTTGETLIGLVNEAQRQVRIIAPYVDERGVRALLDVLVAATKRDVDVELFDGQPGRDNVRWMAEAAQEIQRVGRREHVRLSRTKPGTPFAHLKLVVRDGNAAYVGSANVTGAALVTGNLELGMLVWGPDVAVIERMLDAYRE